MTFLHFYLTFLKNQFRIVLCKFAAYWLLGNDECFVLAFRLRIPSVAAGEQFWLDLLPQDCLQTVQSSFHWLDPCLNFIQFNLHPCLQNTINFHHSFERLFLSFLISYCFSKISYIHNLMLSIMQHIENTTLCLVFTSL